MVIVSGVVGIDAITHQERTHDRRCSAPALTSATPKENKKLFEKVLERGTDWTEFL
jgi:hypothetical protein